MPGSNASVVCVLEPAGQTKHYGTCLAAAMSQHRCFAQQAYRDNLIPPGKENEPIVEVVSVHPRPHSDQSSSAIGQIVNDIRIPLLRPDPGSTRFADWMRAGPSSNSGKSSVKPVAEGPIAGNGGHHLTDHQGGNLNPVGCAATPPDPNRFWSLCRNEGSQVLGGSSRGGGAKRPAEGNVGVAKYFDRQVKDGIQTAAKQPSVGGVKMNNERFEGGASANQSTNDGHFRGETKTNGGVYVGGTRSRDGHLVGGATAAAGRNENEISAVSRQRPQGRYNFSKSANGDASPMEGLGEGEGEEGGDRGARHHFRTARDELVSLALIFELESCNQKMS